MAEQRDTPSLDIRLTLPGHALGQDNLHKRLVRNVLPVG